VTPGTEFPNPLDATRVEPLPDAPGRYRANLSTVWDAPVHPSGGMVCATALRAMQAELDLSPMSAAALVQVEQESGCAIEPVATRIGLSHSATVRLIDKLVERGLVAKDRARQDQRQQSLKLTKAGQRAAARLHQVRNQVTDDLLSLVPPAEGEALGKAIAAILHRAVTTRQEGDMVCRVCDENRCRPEICPIQA